MVTEPLRVVVPQGPPSTFISPLVEALRRTPTSLALAGAVRSRLTRVALGLAERLDPECIWFDLRARLTEPPPWQLPLLDRFPTRRRRTIYVDEMHLDLGAAGPVDTVLDSRDPVDSGILTLADLMRIPQSVRDFALDWEPGGTPRVFLLTNAERASAAFEGKQGALRRYIEALNRFGLTALVTTKSRPRENVRDFDLAFLVEEASSEPGSVASVTCLANRNPGVFPAIPPGTRYAADSIERRTDSQSKSER
jgi:hypothetical protein